jgi:hypothetical protein
MRFVARGILGLAAAAGLIAAYGCSSDITDEPTPTAGTGGASGATGAGGTGGVSACMPTDPICYGGDTRGPGLAGSECMANIDNTGASRVQFRQTWSRVISPPGLTEQNVYSILKGRSQLKLDQCYSTGRGGYIQITSWDKSNSDPALQTFTTGYASYSGERAGGVQDTASVVRDGLCFLEWNYTFHGPATVNAPISITRWQDAESVTRTGGSMAQPWHITPVVAKRVTADFDAATLRGTVPVGEARNYVDEATGYMHSYSPLSYVTLLDNGLGGTATPIREVEIVSKFNDGNFNCTGRFRADKMDPAANCDTGLDQSNPQWGCLDDAAGPPRPNMGTATGAGAGASYSAGYYLIVDLERIWSTSLGATLCVVYQGSNKAIADGWAKAESEGGWGLNCRGSPNWDPDAANDAGLPRGDWCSRTNGPSDDECHDAYRSLSYSAAQAFKVKEASRTGNDNSTWVGTCPVATQ